MLSVIAVSVQAEVNSTQQKMVKSAFVLNIAKFVTWPDPVYQLRPKQLKLCLFEQDALGVGFEIIRNRSVNGRRLIKRVVNELEQAQACDVLFVDASLLSAYESALQKNFSGQPLSGVLVVADRTGSEQPIAEPINGVQVALIRRGDRIGFEVNLVQSRTAQLKLSSELLKLSTIVGGD